MSVIINLNSEERLMYSISHSKYTVLCRYLTLRVSLDRVPPEPSLGITSLQLRANIV